MAPEQPALQLGMEPRQHEVPLTKVEHNPESADRKPAPVPPLESPPVRDSEDGAVLSPVRRRGLRTPPKPQESPPIPPGSARAPNRKIEAVKPDLTADIEAALAKLVQAAEGTSDPGSPRDM